MHAAEHRAELGFLCRSISCWALSRYAQWIVERCSDSQQDVKAAHAQLDEVLQVLAPAMALVIACIAGPGMHCRPLLLPCFNSLQALAGV